METAVSRMSSGTVEGCRRCNMLRRLPRRRQPMAASDHGWSQSSQQRHPCCIEPWGTLAVNHPYVGVWEGKGKGRVVGRAGRGLLIRMCMLFQKASLQAHNHSQLEEGKSASLVCVHAGQRFHHLG